MWSIERLAPETLELMASGAVTETKAIVAVSTDESNHNLVPRVCA